MPQSQQIDSSVFALYQNPDFANAPAAKRTDFLGSYFDQEVAPKLSQAQGVNLDDARGRFIQAHTLGPGYDAEVAGLYASAPDFATAAPEKKQKFLSSFFDQRVGQSALYADKDELEDSRQAFIARNLSDADRHSLYGVTQFAKDAIGALPRQVGTTLLQAGRQAAGFVDAHMREGALSPRFEPTNMISADGSDLTDKSRAVKQRADEIRDLRYSGHPIVGEGSIFSPKDAAASAGYGMASSAPSAVGGLVAGPPGAAVGAALSAPVAFFSQRDEFLSNVLDKANEQMLQTQKRRLTQEESDQLVSAFGDAASRYGAWEAIPEAASNMIFGSILGKAVKGFGGATRAIRAAKFAGAEALDLAGEHASETASQYGQGAEEAKAGLRAKAPTIQEAFREQAPITNTLFVSSRGLGIAGGKLASKLGIIKSGEQAAQQVGAQAPQPDAHRDLIAEAQPKPEDGGYSEEAVAQRYSQAHDAPFPSARELLRQPEGQWSPAPERWSQEPILRADGKPFPTQRSAESQAAVLRRKGIEASVEPGEGGGFVLRRMAEGEAAATEPAAPSRPGPVMADEYSEEAVAKRYSQAHDAPFPGAGELLRQPEGQWSPAPVQPEEQAAAQRLNRPVTREPQSAPDAPLTQENLAYNNTLRDQGAKPAHIVRRELFGGGAVLQAYDDAGNIVARRADSRGGRSIETMLQKAGYAPANTGTRYGVPANWKFNREYFEGARPGLDRGQQMGDVVNMGGRQPATPTPGVRNVEAEAGQPVGVGLVRGDGGAAVPGGAGTGLGGESPVLAPGVDPATDARRAAAGRPDSPQGAEAGRAVGRSRPVTAVSGTQTERLPARYELRELDSITPSHDPLSQFAKTPGYPEGVQDRPYHSSAAHQEQVATRVARFDPDHIVNTSATAEGGPSVVTRDGIVLGGNSRAMILRSLAAQHPERYQKYVQALREDAQSFGFTPEQVEGFRQPVLVRALDFDMAEKTPQELGRISGVLNKPSMTGQDRVTKGVAVAKGLSRESLEIFAASVGGYDTLRDYLSSPQAVQKLVPALERDGVLDVQNRDSYLLDGKLTPEGKNIVEDALRGFVIPDNDLLQRLRRSGADEMRSLDFALPHLAYLKASGEEWVSDEMGRVARLFLDYNANRVEWQNKHTGPRRAYSPEFYLHQPSLLQDVSEIRADRLAVEQFRALVHLTPREFAAVWRGAAAHLRELLTRPAMPGMQLNTASVRRIAEGAMADYDAQHGRAPASLRALQEREMAEAERTPALSAEDAAKAEEQNAKDDEAMFSGGRRAPGFYSQLERVLEAKLPGSAKAADMGATVEAWARKGDFKADELEWSSLREWLEAQGERKLAKADVLDYLRQGGVKVEEVLKGGDGKGRAGFEQGSDGGPWSVFMRSTGETVAEYENEAEARAEVQRINAVHSDTKFGQYQLPGGENYRELLLTLPTRPSMRFEDFLKGYRERFPNTRADEQMIREYWKAGHGLPREGTLAGTADPAVFRSSHFEEPNILAHVRFNERTDAEGKRILFIEEIQSDWAQKGRKEGFADASRRYTAADFEITYDPSGDKGFPWRVTQRETGDEINRAADEQTARDIVREEIERRDKWISRQTVPNAPFVKNTSAWSMLAMKRMIRWAAENGFERIAWTTGEQQAERYDLSKQVSSIVVLGRTDAATGNRSKAFNLNIPSGSTIYLGVDNAGMIDNARGLDGAKGKLLSDVVGKGLAEKLMSSESGAILTGEDLKVGGEGMKGFYDKILPSETSKLIKKWGSKVGETELDVPHIGPDKYQVEGTTDSRFAVRGPEGDIEETFPTRQEAERAAKTWNEHALEEATHRVHAFDITPQMREGAMAGQPMFAGSRTPERVRFDRIASVELTGKEIADFAAGADFGAARRAASTWAAEHGVTGTFRNAETGWDIEVTKRGIRDSMAHGAGEQKLQAVAGIPAMLERGVLVRSTGPDAKGLASHIFAAKLRIGENDYVAGLVVREDRNGRRFYDHELSNVESLDAATSKSGGASAVAEVGHPAPLQGSVMNIVRQVLGVNPDIMLSGQAHFMPGGPRTRTDGMNANTVRGALQDMQARAKNARPMEVVQSFADLPQRIRDAAAERGLDFVEGVYDPRSGKVWMVADAFSGRKRVVEVWMHEQCAHRGLRGLFGDERRFEQFLRGVYSSLGGRAGLRELADSYGYDLANPTHQLRATEEYLARLTEKIRLDEALTPQEQRTWNRVVRAVKAMLRELGIRVEYSDAEISQILRESVYWTFEGEAGGGPRGQGQLATAGASFSAAERGQNEHLDSALDKIGAPKTPLAERMKEAVADFRRGFEQGVFDQFASLRRVDREAGTELAEDSAYVAASMTTSLGSVMQAVMEHGAPVWREGGADVAGEHRGFATIFKPVAGEVDRWCAWMVGRRAEKLMAEGRENLFTPEEIHALKELGKGREQAFEQVWRDYVSFKKQVLDFAQEAGVIDPEGRKIWEHDEYIPFYRVMEEGGVKGPRDKKGIADQNSGIKTLKGGTSNIGDPFENIIRNFTHLIDASMKNHAMNLAMVNAENVGVARKMDLRWEAVKLPAGELQAALRKVFGERDAVRSMSAAQRASLQTLFRLTRPQGKDVVSVLRAGKPVYYQVSDPLLLRALTAMNQSAIGGWAMRGARFLKRLLTYGVTATPEFMLRNLTRDTISAWAVDDKGSFKPVLGSLRGLTKTLRGEADTVRMMAAGASFDGGHALGHDPAAAKLLVERVMRRHGIEAGTVLNTPQKLGRFLRDGWERWERVGQAVENSTRTEIYSRMRERGNTHLEAAFESKKIMDFSQRGDWPAIRFLCEVVPFFGARLVGLHRLGRGFMENPAAFMAKGGAVALASVALYLANKDKEEFQALEQFDRDNYYHFWLGGAHYRLPKPFEIGALFGTIPERLTEQFVDKDAQGKLFAQRMQYMLTQTFQVGFPQFMAPVVEQVANKSFFTDRPIVGQRLARLRPEEQHDAGTSATMIEAGRVTGLSPKRLEHLVNAYFGTLGTYVLGAADMVTRNALGYPEQPARRTSDLPVLRSFYREGPSRNTRQGSELYDMLRDVEATYNTVTELRRTGDLDRARELAEAERASLRLHPMASAVQDRLAVFDKRARLIQVDRAMSAEEKRVKLDELAERRNAYVKRMHATMRGRLEGQGRE
ncbi:MAG: hypothetical protein HY916_09080 [Desulfovibrio sp.]|jgi:hypothetical protein|nr:hypothetical protein [Desulfovibrio sp.]